MTLDFSHLSQSGWVAHRLSTQRETISRWLRNQLCDGGHKAPSSAPKGATPRLLARFLGSVSSPFGTVSLAPSGAPERRRFQLVKASEAFCVLVSALTRKKSYGNPRNLEQCVLLRNPMAKVEHDGVLRNSRGLGPENHPQQNEPIVDILLASQLVSRLRARSRSSQVLRVPAIISTPIEPDRPSTARPPSSA